LQYWSSRLERDYWTVSRASGVRDAGGSGKDEHFLAVEKIDSPFVRHVVCVF